MLAGLIEYRGIEMGQWERLQRSEQQERLESDVNPHVISHSFADKPIQPWYDDNAHKKNLSR